MVSKKQNASLSGGVQVDLAGGQDATNKNSHAHSSINADILRSKSTSLDTQLAKVVVLLRSGPKTTIELRKHGVMMPAARVFTLRREQGYLIETELVSLYDAEGIRHRKCARYHLKQDQIDSDADEQEAT
jgi:hypothetical protein